MRLDELPWQNSEIDPAMRFAWKVPARVGYINILHSPRYGYRIYHRADDGNLMGEDAWFDLDPITAQCVITHLTQGGNDHDV